MWLVAFVSEKRSHSVDSDVTTFVPGSAEKLPSCVDSFKFHLPRRMFLRERILRLVALTNLQIVSNVAE